MTGRLHAARELMDILDICDAERFVFAWGSYERRRLGGLGHADRAPHEHPTKTRPTSTRPTNNTTNRRPLTRQTPSPRHLAARSRRPPRTRPRHRTRGPYRAHRPTADRPQTLRPGHAQHPSPTLTPPTGTPASTRGRRATSPRVAGRSAVSGSCSSQLRSVDESLDTSKESPHRRGQTSFSGVGRDLICGSEGDSTAALAGTMRTVIAARCPDGGSSPTAHWWAGLGGGRRTQGAVQRPARTGALADGSRGSAAEPGGSRPQGRHDQLG
jgi:hypothetical protein